MYRTFSPALAILSRTTLICGYHIDPDIIYVYIIRMSYQGVGDEIRVCKSVQDVIQISSQYIREYNLRLMYIINPYN